MVDEITKKFPKQEDAIKKQQATMDLYKKAGVSPMGGCLPQLLQMPILFAMFRFFPTSIELRHQSFLWATDLSTYDSILNLPFTIPLYGSHCEPFHNPDDSSHYHINENEQYIGWTGSNAGYEGYDLYDACYVHVYA